MAKLPSSNQLVDQAGRIKPEWLDLLRQLEPLTRLSRSQVTALINGLSDNGSILGGSFTVIVRTYTATTTWTKPAGPTFIGALVRLQAGGGGGKSKGTTAGRAGHSGGGGAYGEKWIPAANLVDVVTVEVGAGGAGGPGDGTAGGNDGADGGSSAFGSYCSVEGGKGGTGVSTVLSGSAEPGGIGIGCDIVFYGRRGLRGTNVAVREGGGSMLGFGSITSASDPTGYGAGGAGGYDATTADNAGGNGAPGIVFVEERYSS